MDALSSFLIEHDALLPGRKVLERTTFLLSCVAALVAAVFVWASLFSVDRVVRVEGRVIPTGRSRPVQHLEGGIVSALRVAEGAHVKKGDVLLSIDATTAGANLNEAAIKLEGYRARAARLEAEAALEDAVVFPQSLAGKEVAKSELKLFQARKAKRVSDAKVHEETMRQHKAALEETWAQEKSYTQELVVARERVKMLEGMAARQAASRMELLDAQSREKRLETEVQAAATAKPKIEAALSAEQARAQAVTADYKTEAQNQLVETLAEIERLEQIMTTARDRVARTDVRAPMDGTINRLGVASVGAVVKPGDSVVELTPLSEEIVIEARVPPKDRGELHPGIAAKIRISAYDSAALGALEGVLKEISADTMLDAQGHAYYRATLLVAGLPAAYAGRPALPGMTVLGDLVAGRNTVLEHLLSPVRKFSTNVFRESR